MAFVDASSVKGRLQRMTSTAILCGGYPAFAYYNNVFSFPTKRLVYPYVRYVYNRKSDNIKKSVLSCFVFIQIDFYMYIKIPCYDVRLVIVDMTKPISNFVNVYYIVTDL